MYRVVLVDDEQFILKGLIRVFPWEKYGCTVVGTAGDGREGLALVHQEKPDILLTDIRMPGMDGLQMIAALRSEFPDMLIAVLTAFREFDFAREALHLGVVRFLLKPSSMDELEEAFSFMTAALQARGKTEDEAQAGETGEAGGYVVNAALKYMETHYQERLTLSLVADNVYVSQWHLSKLFNGRLHKGFFDLLNDIRVARAKEMLCDPALSAAEVAFRVGYGDAAQFSRTFKKLTGHTPAGYRAALPPA